MVGFCGIRPGATGTKVLHSNPPRFAHACKRPCQQRDEYLQPIHHGAKAAPVYALLLGAAAHRLGDVCSISGAIIAEQTGAGGGSGQHRKAQQGSNAGLHDLAAAGLLRCEWDTM